MGYDVHITRASAWSESELDPITLGEWLVYVKSDSEMRLDGFAEARTPADEVLRYENPGLAVWTGWSRSGQAWFDHRNGRIVVKNPDDEILAKMCSIAREIGARVQGDEGEYYPRIS